MNTITQIENALKAINQAGFQSLINHLLYLQGNKFIGAPGAVVGKEKTSKGTPDSFFVNGEKYIFVECTTKEKLGKSKSFFEKLSKDVDHCFKEEETTINKKKIERVILACTEKISPEEYSLLKEKVQVYNPETKFDVFNIQNLPLTIYDFPKLADEYLNVEIVKGDIFTLEEFLLKTTKWLQPSLTNEFVGREEEIKKCVEALKRYDKLLLSGGAGVGKSKLAVKILEELSKEGYIPIVIQSSAVPLWDDFKHLFQSENSYIVLFDDANKSIQNLNYLLSIIDKPKSFSVKVIITSRDYVKKQVSSSLNDHLYEEVIISEFKDEEIEKIIIKALPNLKYHIDIKRKIVELAKGNARVALMATYSVTPDAETNYLNSPVLLYEKYFEKISEEIGIFDDPIILKSLAIVSFFGVLDRNNETLKAILFDNFGIDWNELWSAIMELHSHEILDVYSSEVVKVSDQVLATYAFYKCFIEDKSAVINYATWIIAFMTKFSHRIRATLIDVNNTFVYYHIKELVMPHLNEVLKEIHSDDQFYSFYELFWFYKDRECLLYLKKWIETLPQEQNPENLTFSYVHNDHTRASKHFELLKNFWNHPNELLKPSIELTLDLLVKQPSRLPEVLKFIHEDFQYKRIDFEAIFFRQNIILDVFLDKSLVEHKKAFANGIFLNLAEALLGWHYTEFGSGKGASFTIYNFDLYKSDELMKLRERILNQVYHLFEAKDEQVQKILQKVIYPGGNIDKTIYVDELPIYQKLIVDKLDNTQYSHCKFVKTLAKHFTKAETTYPESWNDFIESDIMKLSKFLKPGWEYRNDKSIEESEKEKKEEFEYFIKSNDWNSIENFLLNIDAFYKQQTDTSDWFVESAITDIYVSLAKKGRIEFESALRLFFSGKVLFPLGTTVVNFALQNKIMTGEELLDIINEYDFSDKVDWQFELLTSLPENQVNNSFLNLLIKIFSNSEINIYVYRMLNYLKYQKEFESYKKDNLELAKHNIITYLTGFILLKTNKKRHHQLGIRFCTECAPYFINDLKLFRKAYLSQKEAYQHFDNDGKELAAVLELDKYFINECLKNGEIGLGHSSRLRLKNFALDELWGIEDYEIVIEDILLITLEKEKYIFPIEDDILSLFTFRSVNEIRSEKVHKFISNIINKYFDNKKMMQIIIMVIYHNFKIRFVEYFKQFLLLNKNIDFIREISFSRSESWTGSRVPIIQNKIDFYNGILEMIKTLPDTLDYTEHIAYFEQKIKWKKKEIQDEQRKDFMEEFY